MVRTSIFSIFRRQEEAAIIRLTMRTLRRTMERIMPLALCATALVIGGCTYDEPITTKPTRKVEPGLIGDWTSTGEHKEHMRVRQLDDRTYVLTYDGDLYRAYHSDVAGLALVSVQSLQPEQRKYAYLTWKLAADGKTLALRVVNEKVVPENLKTSAAVQKRLKKNAANPDLFEEEVRFSKDG